MSRSHITHWWSRYRIYLMILMGFALYLLIISNVTALLIPCLTFHPNVSYSYADCNVAKALDQYMLLALGGFGITIVSFYVLSQKRSLKILALVSVVLAVEIIAMYLLYIPMAEAHVRQAPLILESLK